MSTTLELNYFNTFWLKKLKNVVNETPSAPTAPYNNVPRAYTCLLYTSPSPRDRTRSRMPSSA